MRTLEARVDDQVVAMAVPDGFAATPVPGGFVLRLKDADSRRGIHEITVTFDPDGSVPETLTRRRTLGERTALFRVDRLEGGGSGGAETTLRAAVPCRSGTIRLRLDTQAEDGFEPYFDLAWTVLESTRCR